MPLYLFGSAQLTALVAADNNTSGFIKDTEGWRVVSASGVAVPLTGSTSETTLATITIPAGAMGANGVIRAQALFSYTNSANNKTLRSKFGGTQISANIVTTTVACPIYLTIANRNAQNSQITGLGNGLAAASTITLPTMANDTSAAVDLIFTGQLASAAETITLESYLVELKYGA